MVLLEDFSLKMFILTKLTTNSIGNYLACKELTNQSPPGEYLNDSFITTGN